MRYILIILILPVCIAEEINLNFHQNDYDIKWDIAECFLYNKSYFKSFECGMVLYNRTQRVFNCTLELAVDLNNNLMFAVQMYKHMSNEYRFFPLTVNNANVCAEYIRNTFGMKDIITRMTTFKPCGMKTGVYYVRNAIPDHSKFPPHIPRGLYKIAVHLVFHSFAYAEVHLYFRVVDKPTDWRKIPKSNRYLKENKEDRLSV